MWITNLSSKITMIYSLFNYYEENTIPVRHILTPNSLNYLTDQAAVFKLNTAAWSVTPKASNSDAPQPPVSFTGTEP